MAKVLKGILGVVLMATAFIPGLNVLSLGAKALLAVGMAGVSMTLSFAAEKLFGPKVPNSQLSRLNVSLDPSTPRKAVFGTTAMNLDLRYHEVSGTNQEYVDYIVLCAAHKVASIDEIWFDDKQAWTAVGGVTSTYNGYLTVTTRTEGTSGNYISINGGSTWGSTRRLTGCAYIHLRIKRTGATSKVESPLVNGLPSRVTIRGNGALLYDPRKDSTVTGGSGSHRANDQTTWGSYTDPDDCDNPALQLLWWLLGWKINNVLSIGCGVPYTRIDMESFITAANICDENITLAAGGTQKRYRTSATASDSDDRMDIINTFLSCMNGTLRDNDGKLTLTVMKNDLANYVLSFNDDDILDSFEWNQTRGLTETYNVARGRYVDPSDNSLYQLVDYPEVRIDSPDGIERVVTIDLPYVEEGRRAQRIAKQVLQRNQYRGMFSATFTAKAMGCQVGDVVRLSFEPLGWSNKLFRVISQQIDFTGRVPMSLVEENAAIYAWDAEEQAVVTPTAPTVYNPLNNPFILGALQASSRHEPNDASLLFTANYQGTIDAGQLPKNLIIKRISGTTDVSADATWTIESQTGISGVTVTVTDGVVTIPSSAIIASSATIVVKSNYQDTDIYSNINVTRIDSSPPNTGSGASTVNDSSFNSVSSTTLTAISDIMTVKTGSSGQIVFSAPLGIYVEAASPDGEFGAIGQWKYRAVGGSFSNAGSQADDVFGALVSYDYDFSTYLSFGGYIDVSATVTGLSANTDYEVQLYAARDTSSPAKTIYFSGTASATGS